MNARQCPRSSWTGKSSTKGSRSRSCVLATGLGSCRKRATRASTRTCPLAWTTVKTACCWHGTTRGSLGGCLPVSLFRSIELVSMWVIFFALDIFFAILLYFPVEIVLSTSFFVYILTFLLFCLDRAHLCMLYQHDHSFILLSSFYMLLSRNAVSDELLF